MADISAPYNPFDFAHPISDAELFVGRESEMREIAYYLDQAKAAPHPISIAILGQRASGKTSVLNMTEVAANERGLCVARLDLDEGDVKSELVFFHKLFHGVLTEACRVGAFQGVSGKTYEAYLDMVYAFSIPEDKTFCPFLFPLVYARAMARGHHDIQAPSDVLEHDLDLIRKEVNRPTVILIDEGNVLAGSRVILEKLRNIFSRLSGFMLVITGTPELLRTMDAVFSPIVREFIKVNVAEFRDENKTAECIKRPLEKISIRPEELFDFETYTDVLEIHDLSGGRPYEIQLICHMLFRRVQDQRASKMKLDVSVLEEVRKELEASRDLGSRRIWTVARKASKRQLSSLGILCMCEGFATFDQIW